MNPLARVIAMEGLAMMRSPSASGDELAGWFSHIADLLETSPAPFRFAPPISVTIDPEQAYDEWAAVYDEGISNEGVAGIERLEDKSVRRVVDRFTVGRVLDAGCGTGRHAAYLSARGHSVVGVDISAGMVEQARKRVPQATFSVASIDRLPFADASFDAVLCALAFGHIADPAPVIGEMARVLAPGAPLVVSHLHPLAIEVLRVQPIFIRSDGSPAYVREHVHWQGDLLDAFIGAGLLVRSCSEPKLTADIAAELGPPNHAASFERALTGLPAFVVWELARG